MKKLVLMFVAIAAISFASCGILQWLIQLLLIQLLLIQLLLILLSNLGLLYERKMRETTARLRSGGFFCFIGSGAFPVWLSDWFDSFSPDAL